jgi:hypothetical protein
VRSFYQALLTGIWVQWLIDSERAPSGRDMAEALRLILGSTQAAGDTRADRDSELEPTRPLPLPVYFAALIFVAS